jgi:hypothetical protein
MFKKASKEDVDKFMSKAILNDNIYPYLSTNKYFGTFEVPDDDWSSLLITNDSNTFIFKVTLRRADEVGMSISLYATSSFSAGRALIAINEVIRRYKPRYVDTTVHSSNTKSIKLNSKLLGEPWGVEPKGAWNAKLGEYEDLVYFKKLFA